jgi:SAM-dependent methyltransferase
MYGGEITLLPVARGTKLRTKHAAHRTKHPARGTRHRTKHEAPGTKHGAVPSGAVPSGAVPPDAVPPDAVPAPSGATGWDDYADFYDWENAQTMARRDVPFWTRVAAAAGGPVLEFGCGTGRIALPLARAGTPVVGIDLSARMLARARGRVRRARLGRRVHLVRGDIRRLPFPDDRFALVMAPYGILQSLTSEDDLGATLRAVRRALRPGGRIVMELVADLPAWQEYSNETKLRGWRAGRRSHVTLVESVRQDRSRGLTLFEQEFVERRDGAAASRRFTLAFRTLSVRQMASRLAKAGLNVTARLGSYTGDPWTPSSDTWILIAER